jgi:NADPH2:quinone reductase
MLMKQNPPIPDVMLAVAAPNPGGPEALQIVQRPTPRPVTGEVLIKVISAGLNGADISQRKGRYLAMPGLTDVLGLEVSGTVAAIGEGAVNWAVGDEVCALLIGGGYAEYCTVPAVQCLPVPRGVDALQAAALPEVAITVWSNVFEIGRLSAGETVLLHGGTSGIGTFAIQLARSLGSRVIVTAGSDDKCARCLDLGADHAINYRTEDFGEAARRMTGGKGVDVILDIVGGDYIQRGLETLAPGGRLVSLGFKQATKVEVDCALIQTKNLQLTGSRLRPRPVAEKGRLVAEVRKKVWPLVESGAIKPVVDSVYAVKDVQDAHRRMESSEHVGKILLEL